MRPCSSLSPFVTGDIGAVRRYNVIDKTFDEFVPSRANGGPLERPVFATFCNTDPATLAYGDPDNMNPMRCTPLP